MGIFEFSSNGLIIENYILNCNLIYEYLQDNVGYSPV